jgi:hypothetical protein
MASLCATSLCATALCATAWCTTYYVDGVAGADTNAGTLPSSAWQSLNRVGQAAFRPGDYILFKRGQVWNGQLTISSSGVPDSPIVYGAFGTGAAPVIDGTGIAIPAQEGLVNSDGQTNLIVRDLEIRNSPVDAIVPYLANGLKILNCTVHDNQFNGILAFNGNNVTIDGSAFYHNSLNLAASYAGIAIDGDMPPQSNIVISNNAIHDNIGGEGWLGANGIYFGHTGTEIPTIQNVLVTGNDIFRNGNPDQDQAGRGISGSFNGDVTVEKNRIYENASAGIYLGDVNLTLTIAISHNVFRDNALRQFGGITNGSGLAEQNLLYVDNPALTAMGAEVGGNGPWTIRYNVFTFVTNTNDQYRGFIRINDPVQDGLLQSNFNVFYSAGPNRWKRSNGTILSFSQWQSFGLDANSVNLQ